jgi:hypothetical protein
MASSLGFAFPASFRKQGCMSNRKKGEKERGGTPATVKALQKSETKHDVLARPRY